MPMFDFSCPACAVEFEDLVFGDDCPACPQCGGMTERKISSPSPRKTGAFPFKPGGVHPAVSSKNLNVGCPGSGGFQ